jgi:hypothetical protein
LTMALRQQPLPIKGLCGMNGTKIAVEIRRTTIVKLPDDARRRMAAQ